MVIFRRLAALPLAIVAVLGAASLLEVTRAQEGDGPVVTYQSPEDGAVLGEQPFVLQLCFEDPINTKDLDKGGDFAFSLISDSGLGFGMRIVFQPDGYGVAVYPGSIPSPLLPTPEEPGPWVFKYLVTDNVTLQVLEGEITFTVEEGAEPIPTETPPACAASGDTPGSIVSQESPGGTARVTRTPIPGEETEEPDDPEASPDEENGIVEEEDDDDDPDILLLALLTIGVAGALAGIALLAYLVRRRIGHDPHRSSGDGGEHH